MLKKIKIAMSDPTLDIAVPALIIDGLGLHKTLKFNDQEFGYDTSYTITHCGTGRAIMSNLSYEVAVVLIHDLSRLTNWNELSFPVPDSERETLKKRIQAAYHAVLKRIDSYETHVSKTTPGQHSS